MLEASGFITAGGHSSRMGTDKAWLALDGKPMISHVIAAVAPVTTDIAIIANDARYEALGYPVFRDQNPGVGPLEAIRTALANAHASHALLVGCDLPFVTSELLKFLLSTAEERQVTIPLSISGTPEPLCAIYCTDALTLVSELILRGDRRPSALFCQVPTRFVAFEEIRPLNRSLLFFENVNTPEDYRRATEAAEINSRN